MHVRDPTPLGELSGRALVIRTVPPTLSSARSLVDPWLSAAMDRLCPNSRLVGGYHFGWHDAEGSAILNGGGKALRPALTLLSAQAAGGTAEDGLPAATAIELVHNFSIIHDDVIDRDERRRHQLTAWVVFGDARAILTGDALMALACQVLLDCPSPYRTDALGRLAQAVADLVRGQQADLSFERRLDVSVGECLDMVGDKTAALMSCAASIGAVLVGASARLVDGLSSYGKHLGVAFQGVDDLLGIWGQPDRTGKPVGSDLRQKKKSLPVVYAMSRGDRDSERLTRILALDMLGDDEVAVATGLLEHSGAREWVNHLVDRQTSLTLQALEQLEIPEVVGTELAEIARFAASREQ